MRENRAELQPALTHLRGVVTVLHKNQDNLDRSLVRLAPFVRVFANNLGNGRWFDTLVQQPAHPRRLRARDLRPAAPPWPRRPPPGSAQ